jgi:hypothetical protein
MKKTIKQNLRLKTETLRNLELKQFDLAKIAGGLASVPCGTHGCTFSGCCPEFV